MSSEYIVLLDETLTVVLAGGIGSRLKPLTADRAKPAVPFGGKYRIIDFTLTNCLHSGLRRILVLTQYKSHSLQKHLRDGWSIYNPELGEYITVVPPQMRTGQNWYTGTSDALYQNLYLLERSKAKWVVVLSGDHIYRMDYLPMIKAHQENAADLTVACMDVSIEEAKSFGVMGLDNDSRIISFREKPENPQASPYDAKKALVSMGVYVFSLDKLVAALKSDFANKNSSHDFGQDIIPGLIKDKVYAHRFGGEVGRVSPDLYWRDVGTIDSYYEANMDLLMPVPPMNLYQEDWRIRTYAASNPPARTAPGEDGTEGIFINSIAADGVVISGSSVQSSILSSNVHIGEDSIVEDSLLLDGVTVGKACQLRNCIIDKYVSVPDGVQIGYDAKLDGQRFHVSEKGIVVVPKDHQFK